MSEYVRNKINSIEFLPTFPHVVDEMMTLINDPRSSASDLARHMDPSMVSEVLKVANSAYFGRKNFRQIATIEQAVAVIGYAGLSCIVLQMPLFALMRGGTGDFDRKGFVQHSLACGTMAKAVSEIFSLGNPNTVYISGTLHDIGIIVIFQYFKDEWKEIDRLIEQERLSRLEAEREVLSVDHAYVGAVLLEKWDLPDAVTESVRLHHSPERIGENGDAYATWLSNKLAKHIDFESGFEDFDTFFKQQRELLHTEMPDKYLTKHHVGVLERGYTQLSEIERFIEETLGEQ